MGKRNVTFFTGGYYHIFNRGSDRKLIFKEARNYAFLLRRLGDHVSRMSISVIAYCLMPNHYHFLLRQDGETSISDLVQGVFNSYSKAFNRMYKRSGTLFEGPFKSIFVDDENYLIHLCRYIHCNPLEAELVKDTNSWPFSNYLEWVGRRNGRLIDRNFVKTYFECTDQYEAFVGDVDDVEMKRSKIQKYLF